MNIDDIKYGNPAKSHIERVKADVGGLLKSAMNLGIIDDIITNHKFPANSSDETKEELEYLVQLTKHADDDIIRYCQLMESHHYDLFVVVGKRLGLDVTKEQILKWVSDVDPITFYLKDKFNRPRPHQLGKGLNIPLYPVIVTDADSAAYPSGHTMDFLVILYHFGKMKPELAGKLSEFYETIKNVREISGLHYPSDRKCSEYLFKQLVKNNLIK